MAPETETEPEKSSSLAKRLSRDASLAARPQPGSLVPQGEELAAYLAICKAFVDAKMVPGHFNTPEKALAAALRGRDLGLAPTMAWAQLYPVDQYNDQGERSGVTLGMMVDLQMALATSRIPGFWIDFREQTTDAVEIWFHRPRWPVLKVRRTAAWAHQAGLPMKKDGRTMRANWARDFAAMLTARVKSIGLHQIAADVLQGMYPPDEIVEYQEATAMTEASGAIIDATNFKEVAE